jgi:hypothetical protein
VKPSNTLYHGERVTDDAGRILGQRVTVNGRVLSPDRSRKVFDHSPDGFEWGYGGSGPAQLALALILDATGSPVLARRAYQWFKWATVACWGRAWTITAGEIFEWLRQWERETRAELDGAGDPDGGQVETKPAQPVCVGVRRCRACGCRDEDCRQCVAATGYPCAWVKGEDPPLCTRCAARARPGELLPVEGGVS